MEALVAQIAALVQVQTEGMQNMMTELTTALVANKQSRGFCDTKMLQSLKTFAGCTEEFHDWQRKAKKYLQCFSELTVTMMTEAEARSATITKQAVKDGYGDEGVRCDTQLNAYLVSHTDGQAALIVSSANGSVCEAWRLLMKRYDPRTSEDKRALMRRVINTQPAKSMMDLERYLQEWEATLRRYEKATSKQLDDDIKVNCIIALCAARLQEHLNMTIEDDEDFERVRSEIIRQIEKNRPTSGPVPMDVGSWDGVEPNGSWHDSKEDVDDEDSHPRLKPIPCPNVHSIFLTTRQN